MTKLPELLKKYGDIYALIWTTTPWTLPSNQAICFHEKIQYSLVNIEEDNNYYVIASELVESLSKSLKKNVKILETFPGIIGTGLFICERENLFFF